MEHPGEVNHGATGTGPTFVQELFKYRTGTEFENLMYEGMAPAIQDMRRGDIQFPIDLIPGVTAQVDAGQVKAIAVSSTVPSKTYPGPPTATPPGVAAINATKQNGMM